MGYQLGPSSIHHVKNNLKKLEKYTKRTKIKQNKLDMRFNYNQIVFVLLTTVFSSIQGKRFIPDNLVSNVIHQMKIYEDTKSCESYFEILKMTAKMENILCSLKSDEDFGLDRIEEEKQMCDAAKQVSLFFVKLLLEKLPKCLNPVIYQAKNRSLYRL